jgi:hypothetical protein
MPAPPASSPWWRRRPHSAVATAAALLLASPALLPVSRFASALDNGFRVPPLGWSSWYGFTSNIDEVMLRAMGDAMVSSGLHAAGYEHIWIDDGWAIGRDNTSDPPGHVIVDPVLLCAHSACVCSRRLVPFHSPPRALATTTSEQPNERTALCGIRAAPRLSIDSLALSCRCRRCRRHGRHRVWAFTLTISRFRLCHLIVAL